MSRPGPSSEHEQQLQLPCDSSTPNEVRRNTRSMVSKVDHVCPKKRRITIQNNCKTAVAKKAKTKVKVEQPMKKKSQKPNSKNKSVNKTTFKSDTLPHTNNAWRFEKRDFNDEESEKIAYKAKTADKTDLLLDPVNFFELFF